MIMLGKISSPVSSVMGTLGLLGYSQFLCIVILSCGLSHFGHAQALSEKEKLRSDALKLYEAWNSSKGQLLLGKNGELLVSRDLPMIAESVLVFEEENGLSCRSYNDHLGEFSFSVSPKGRMALLTAGKVKRDLTGFPSAWPNSKKKAPLAMPVVNTVLAASGTKTRSKQKLPDTCVMLGFMTIFNNIVLLPKEVGWFENAIVIRKEGKTILFDYSGPIETGPIMKVRSVNEIEFLDREFANANPTTDSLKWQVADDNGDPAIHLDLDIIPNQISAMRKAFVTSDGSLGIVPEPIE